MALAPISAVGVDPLQLYRSLPSVGGADPSSGVAGTGAQGFSAMLADKLGSAVELQNQGEAAAQALATGQTNDVSAATIAVEKAAVSMQLVAGVRNKAIEAYQDVMRMQV